MFAPWLHSLQRRHLSRQQNWWKRRDRKNKWPRRRLWNNIEKRTNNWRHDRKREIRISFLYVSLLTHIVLNEQALREIDCDKDCKSRKKRTLENTSGMSFCMSIFFYMHDITCTIYWLCLQSLLPLRDPAPDVSPGIHHVGSPFRVNSLNFK
jgi:hypothetical protein